MNSDLKDDPLIKAGGFRIGIVQHRIKGSSLRWPVMKVPVWGRGRDKKVTGFYYVSVPQVVTARKS